jgi:hypothetical protein
MVYDGRKLIANACGLEATLIGVSETSGALTYWGLFTSTFNGISFHVSRHFFYSFRP